MSESSLPDPLTADIAPTIGAAQERPTHPWAIARPPLDTPYVAPRNALEARLAHIWEEVIPVTPIGIDDDFFDLGGESLHAFAIIARVLKDTRVQLLPRDLFACSSVAAMAAVVAARLLEDAGAASARSVSRRPSRR